MIVHLYGTLRDAAGVKTVPLELPIGASVRQALREVERLYPALLGELLDARSDARADLPLFVNGRNPRLLPDGLDARLVGEDVISLFSPVASGRMNVEVLREKKEDVR